MKGNRTNGQNVVNVILDGEFIHIHGKFMGYSWIMGYLFIRYS